MIIRTTVPSPANHRQRLKRKKCEALGKAASMSMRKAGAKAPCAANARAAVSISIMWSRPSLPRMKPF